MQDYELRPPRDNMDIRREMDARAQEAGKGGDAPRVRGQRALAWVESDFSR